MTRIYYFTFITVCILLVFYSYGLVDPGLKLVGSRHFFLIQEVVKPWFFPNGKTAALFYLLFISLLYIFSFIFLRLLSKSKVHFKKILIILFLLCLFTFPAFSNDLFGYLAYAKILVFYHESPYTALGMDFAGDPLLKFWHWSHLPAQYGPFWIVLSSFPFLLSFGNFLIGYLNFKLLSLGFYLLAVRLIYKLSADNRMDAFYFALSPLIIIDILIDGHNDIVMMGLALLAFYLFKKKKILLSLIFFSLSVATKYSTFLLLPVFCYFFYCRYRQKRISWSMVWNLSALLMTVAFLIASARYEIYSRYFIWPLTFISLGKNQQIKTAATVFSGGLLLRFAPFLYYGDWGGNTPYIKNIITLAAAAAGFLFIIGKPVEIFRLVGKLVKHK